jgi:hypothetical protein
MSVQVRSWVALVAMLAIALGAQAHHSYAAYDMSKIESAQATLKEFHWGAPHSSGEFIIMDKDGTPQVLTLVGGGPASFAKQGFRPKDFNPGDKVTVTWHPMHGGQLGGSIDSITLPDGRTFKDAGFNTESGAATPEAGVAPASVEPAAPK